MYDQYLSHVDEYEEMFQDDVETEKLCNALEVINSLLEGKTVPITPSTLQAVDLLNDVQMENNFECVITPSIMNGDFTIDSVSLEEAKENIFKRIFEKASNAIKKTFNKFATYEGAINASKSKAEQLITKVESELKDVKQLDEKKVKEMPVSAAPYIKYYEDLARKRNNFTKDFTNHLMSDCEKDAEKCTDRNAYGHMAAKYKTSHITNVVKNYIHIHNCFVSSGADGKQTLEKLGVTSMKEVKMIQDHIKASPAFFTTLLESIAWFRKKVETNVENIKKESDPDKMKWLLAGQKIVLNNFLIWINYFHMQSRIFDGYVMKYVNAIKKSKAD